MKKIIAIAMILTGFFSASFGQQKTERYCELMSNQRNFSADLSVTISFGKGDIQTFDSSEIRNISNYLRTNKFESNVDVINYMTAQGWTLITTSYTEDRTSREYTLSFFFKKEFDR